MDEEVTTTAQLAEDFPFIVLQNCNKCGIMIKYAPFGANTLDTWITIFKQYLEEGILCTDCAAKETSN